MKNRILVVPDDEGEEDRLQAFIDGVNALARNELVVRIESAVVVETDLDEVFQLLVNAGWVEALVLGGDSLKQAPDAQSAGKKKAASKAAVGGVCPRCGKMGVLVAATGVCKPCHMRDLREKKNGGGGDGSANASADAPGAPADAGQSASYKAKARQDEKRLREAARIDAVVADAREREQRGDVVLPMPHAERMVAVRRF